MYGVQCMQGFDQYEESLGHWVNSVQKPASTCCLDDSAEQKKKKGKKIIDWNHTAVE